MKGADGTKGASHPVAAVDNAFRQGVALFRAGRLGEAEELGRKSLAAQPDDADALHLLGAVALKRGDARRAMQFLTRAYRQQSDNPELLFNLGMALMDLGRSREAVEAFRRAIAHNPRHIRARRNLGYLLLRKNKVEAATELLEETVELFPQDARSHHFLGNAYRTQNRSDVAIATYRKAISLDPDLAMARLGLCTAQLPLIYNDEEEIAERRAAYEESLHELRDYYAGKPSAVLAQAASAVGSVQPYYLAYQGRNDRDLQALYGELMCRLMAAAYPQWSEPIKMPPPEPDGRIRVGILSGFFRVHSNWKIRMKGWAEQLDRRKIHLTGYYTQSGRDAATEQAAKAFDRFVTGPMPLAQWAETIRNDNLHVLITQEIGMDPTSAPLAALRLAPVQCGSWGHPETSGYPTMDYFLSSELMEPANGQDHYTERLVRLPNLSVHYSLPKLQPAEYSRAELGLRPDSVAYWCCQVLFKYLPRFDDLFPRIAAEVDNCQFVFIRHKSEVTTRQFEERLARAFRRFGMDVDDYCIFVDRMPMHRFAAAMKSVDIFLDSLGWAGCNTTMEAIGVGLPVITCPGDFMRGRHSSAILQMVGLEQAIAPTLEDYVKLAVTLGRDAAQREELRRLTVERHGRAFGDLDCIRGLEDFLCRMAGSA